MNERFDREGLPPELLAQLSKGVTRIPCEDTDRICEIINSDDAAWSVDDVMIAYYRQHQQVLKRKVVASAIGRLINASRIPRASFGRYKRKQP